MKDTPLDITIEPPPDTSRCRTPPGTLPLNPLWTHLMLDTITFETHPDTSHCATPLGHCHHCHWTPLWTHLTAIEHPPRTLPLDPLWTTFLVISRGVQLFYGIAQRSIRKWVLWILFYNIQFISSEILTLSGSYF